MGTTERGYDSEIKAPKETPRERERQRESRQSEPTERKHAARESRELDASR